MDISKKDWKLFRERLLGWQENYMEGFVKEYTNFLNDDKKPASEKFWELEKRIKEDNVCVDGLNVLEKNYFCGKFEGKKRCSRIRKYFFISLQPWS